MIARRIDLLKYWPELLQQLTELKEIAKGENPEIVELWENLDRALNNQFVLSSTIKGIERLEKILGIVANPQRDTLDFRKKRIINRYTTIPPFTIRYLQEKLDFLVGERKAIASIDIENFILSVEIAIQEASLFKEVERTVYMMKPANIVYNQETSINEMISLEEGIIKNTLDRQTRLGTTWSLGRTPFGEKQETVVVK